MAQQPGGEHGTHGNSEGNYPSAIRSRILHIMCTCILHLHLLLATTSARVCATAPGPPATNPRNTAICGNHQYNPRLVRPCAEQEHLHCSCSQPATSLATQNIHRPEAWQPCTNTPCSYATQHEPAGSQNCSNMWYQVPGDLLHTQRTCHQTTPPQPRTQHSQTSTPARHIMHLYAYRTEIQPISPHTQHNATSHKYPASIVSNAHYYYIHHTTTAERTAPHVLRDMTHHPYHELPTYGSKKHTCRMQPWSAACKQSHHHDSIWYTHAHTDLPPAHLDRKSVV